MTKINWSKVKFVKDEEIPEGAVQVHLYEYRNVLRPRGHMEKESIGLYILDKLIGSYESWTNPKYGDNPDEAELLKLLQTNMQEEVDGAFREFIRKINTDPSDAEDSI